MEDQIITFETAKLAKEKGFQEEVKNYFKIGALSKGLIEEDCITTDINFKFSDRPMWARPTQSLLQRWLRERHDIHIWCEKQHKDVVGKYGYRIGMDLEHSTFTFNNWSYEDALEEGLKEALKLIKN